MNRSQSQNDRPDAAASRPRLGRGLILAERVLVAVGVLCLAVVAVSCAQQSLFQSWQARSFDRQLEQALTNASYDQAEWSKERINRFNALQMGEFGAEVTALGRLEIPRAAVSVIVLDGTADDVLELGVGHIEGTARPGEVGNMGIAGHRDSFFRGLRNIEAGDAITLATRDGLARYEVAEISIVDPQDVEVLEPTDETALTLVTCYPFYFVGNAPKRYIVRAHRVAFASWNRERLDLYAQRDTDLASLQLPR